MILYKVTKTHYRQDFDYRTNTAYGDYKVVKRQTDYRTSKSAVTLAVRHARLENMNAARMNAERPGSNPNKYTVDVEIGELPEFRQAGWCDEHGVQLWITVPGLATEPTCIECI